MVDKNIDNKDKNITNKTKQPSRSTIWRRSLSPERLKEINDRRRETSVKELAMLAKRYKVMSPEEKKEYNHQRYLRHKEAYKERAKKQYEKKKSLNQ